MHLVTYAVKVPRSLERKGHNTTKEKEGSPFPSPPLQDVKSVSY